MFSRYYKTGDVIIELSYLALTLVTPGTYNNNNINVYLIKHLTRRSHSNNIIRDLKDNYYLSMKATLNMCVFRTDLKFSKMTHF